MLSYRQETPRQVILRDIADLLLMGKENALFLGVAWNVMKLNSAPVKKHVGDGGRWGLQTVLSEEGARTVRMLQIARFFLKKHVGLTPSAAY